MIPFVWQESINFKIYFDLIIKTHECNKNISKMKLKDRIVKFEKILQKKNISNFRVIHLFASFWMKTVKITSIFKFIQKKWASRSGFIIDDNFELVRNELSNQFLLNFRTGGHCWTFIYFKEPGLQIIVQNWIVFKIIPHCFSQFIFDWIQ